MRKLSEKQKTALKREIEKWHPISYVDIPAHVIEAIYTLNPYETFWQDVERFIWDTHFTL
mgnify:CR=1 FL=1